MKLPGLEIDERTGRAFFCDPQSIALQRNYRTIVTPLHRTPIFGPPEIHPLKVVAAIGEGVAGTKQRLLAIPMQDSDTDFAIGFVLDENGQIRSAIAIEIAPLKEGVDSTREIDLELSGN